MEMETTTRKDKLLILVVRKTSKCFQDQMNKGSFILWLKSKPIVNQMVLETTLNLQQNPYLLHSFIKSSEQQSYRHYFYNLAFSKTALTLNQSHGLIIKAYKAWFKTNQTVMLDAPNYPHTLTPGQWVQIAAASKKTQPFSGPEKAERLDCKLD